MLYQAKKMYFYFCIYATQIMRTNTQNFYMLNYQYLTGMYFNGYNANKRHWGAYIY